jgi:hypothetical protein
VCARSRGDKLPGDLYIFHKVPGMTRFGIN